MRGFSSIWLLYPPAWSILRLAHKCFADIWKVAPLCVIQTFLRQAPAIFGRKLHRHLDCFRVQGNGKLFSATLAAASRRSSAVRISGSPPHPAFPQSPE